MKRAGTRVVVGVDPSTSSTGWAIFRLSGRRWVHHDSGQCKSERAAREVIEALPVGSIVDMHGIESIFLGPAGHGRKVQPITFWQMGWAAGEIKGQLVADGRFAESELWRPQPKEWRKLVGIRGGTRDVVAARTWRWASALVGFELEGARGGKQIDRAMAVGIAFACAEKLCRRQADA